MSEFEDAVLIPAIPAMTKAQAVQNAPSWEAGRSNCDASIAVVLVDDTRLIYLGKTRIAAVTQAMNLVSLSLLCMFLRVCLTHYKASCLWQY